LRIRRVVRHYPQVLGGRPIDAEPEQKYRYEQTQDGVNLDHDGEDDTGLEGQLGSFSGH